MGSPTLSEPDWRQRWLRLLRQIECVPGPADEDALLQRLSQPARPLVLAFVNAHALNSVAGPGALPAEFFSALSGADTLLRDGSGVSVLFKLLHMAPGRNLNGTDFIPRLIRSFNGRPTALLGTREPYLEQAASVVRHSLAPDTPLVCAHGFMALDEYVALVRAQRSALVVLGMGMPRQEAVAAALREAVTHPCLIVCGGAIIDFLGGKTPRAPRWMRRSGIEWLFRLLREPRRLFARYVMGNPLFLARALRLRVATPP